MEVSTGSLQLAGDLETHIGSLFFSVATHL